MAAEAPVLTYKKINSLSRGLPFSARQRGEITEKATERRGFKRAIQEEVNKFAIGVEEKALEIPEAETQVVQAEAHLISVEQRVATDDSSELVVLRRILRVVGDRDFRPPLKALPLVLPLKPFAIKEADPQIIAAKAELEQIRREAQAIKQAVTMKVQDLSKDALPKIDKSYRDLEGVENRILSLSRAVAASSDRNLEFFIGEIPWQADQAVAAYVERIAGSEETLVRFQDFADFMYERMHYKDRTRSEYEMIPESYKKIKDARITTCWKAYLGYLKMIELSENPSLSVPRPRVPAVIDIVGPNIEI